MESSILFGICTLLDVKLAVEYVSLKFLREVWLGDKNKALLASLFLASENTAENRRNKTLCFCGDYFVVGVVENKSRIKWILTDSEKCYE